MRFFLLLLAATAAAQPIVRDLSHPSMVLGGTREYKAILPPAYATSQKRYPVIYWLYGYEQPNPELDAQITAYVAAHDVILVKAGPVDTTGSYPLYFPELVENVDKTLRTVADREHRGVTGYGVAGFLAFFTAGKFPDQVASASSFMGTPEAPLGPKDLDVDLRTDDLFANYDGVRTRFVTAQSSAARLYHAQLNALWRVAREHHETEEIDGIAKTLEFHRNAFATPLPKPTVFTHADVYPNFRVWGWDAVSDRREPGFTVLENVSAKGFRSAVREWLPGGPVIAGMHLSVTSPRLYAPGSAHTVTYIRVSDGKVRRASQKADAQGRLTFDVDGDVYEVGVSEEPLLTISGWQVADGTWATTGTKVALRVKFWNKGAVKSGTAVIQWESPNPGVKFEFPTSRVYGLGPGESATLPVNFTVPDEGRAAVRIIGAEGANRMPLVIPLFPAAASATVFQIADGTTVKVYQHGTQLGERVMGEGNRDNHAAPGESFAVLLPDGENLRAAEVFTDDSCVENSVRGSDVWAGVSMHYSLPAIRKDCTPGHIVHLLAKVPFPGPEFRYFQVQFPVWYRAGEEPK